MSNTLKRSLKNRHIQMIALGGAIGTGLFYGSAPAIQLAGPGIIISYLLGGSIIYLIMRMLGEMAVDNPVSGSFAEYANTYWSEFVGFLSGWNYWINYIIVSMAELTTIGIYVNFWFPDFPQWATSLICLISITAINLLNVRCYGEIEFFTASIKLIAILAMIVFGIYLIFFAKAFEFPTAFANLWVNGGFLPHGLMGVALSLVLVMFSFGGIEQIGITAGEADQPSKTIPKAINQVIWRILLFYIGTLTILMILYPWQKIGVDVSPFVAIFSNMGIAMAANLLNVVVIIAALSVYNSVIYSTSRMLFAMCSQQNAPKYFGHLAANGVPRRGIILSSGITLLAVILNYLFPEQIFVFLVSLAVAAIVVSWFIITVTHLKFKKAKANSQRPYKPKYKALFYPYSNFLCIAFLLLIYIMMWQLPNTRLAVIIMPIWIFIMYLGFKYKSYRKRKIQNIP